MRLSAFEAAIVESGVHNLTYGDRDSLGVFQQRPSEGLGHRGQSSTRRTRREFITARDRAKNGGQSAGQLAQDVQSSGVPAAL